MSDCNNEKLISESFAKSNVISFIMSIFVVAMHLSTTYFYNLDNTIWYNRLFYELSELIRERLAQVAVPMFFWMAGVLFFRDFRPGGVLGKWKNRFKSIVIPYMVWNFLAYLFSVMLGKLPFLSKYIAQRSLAVLSWEDFVEAICWYKYNNFYWFMSVLILQMILAVPIWLCLKNKYLGVACIIASCLIWKPLLINPYFLVGAYMGMHMYDKYKERYSRNQRILAWIALLIIVILIYRYKNVNDYIFNLVLIPAPICLWVALDFTRTVSVEKHPWIRSSFLIYSSQVIVASSWCKLLMLVLPHNVFGEFVDFFGAIALTVLSCCLFNKFCKKYSPGLCNVLNGWRY